MSNNYSVFDIVGPVLIGPSSSHTAGACRLANAARAIFNKPIDDVYIYVYGSFSQTLFGHGTNKALVGGLLGLAPDDQKLTDSLKLAEQENLSYHFVMDETTFSTENKVRFKMLNKDGNKMSVTGVSIGGGNIIINKINDIELLISLKYDTIIVDHLDKPGAVLGVSGILAKSGINIASMSVYRKAKHDRAYMLIEIDQPIDKEIFDNLRSMEGTTMIYLPKLY